MENKKVILCIALGVIVASFVPVDLMATTTDKFGGAALNSHATEIKDFIFGAPIRIAGMMGGAYGLIQSFLSSSPTPFLTFGGVGLVANIIPSFISGVLPVSSMLLP